MQYGYKRKIELAFEEAEKRAREELARQGFGIITEIDVRKTFKAKLNVDFENYVILGACHPSSAYAVIGADKELGLLLPCNVIVYEEKGIVFVSTILPGNLIKMVGNESLAKTAQEIEEKLIEAVDSI